MPENIYTADVYLRLSKEDGDKEESDSIANQRSLILDYLKSMPDIKINKIRIDDGYSGVTFNRPAFNEMLEDIKAGIVNCVVVKDFSRFGRNYIEGGKFIQVLFPRTGVRFIAINDSYDSAKIRSNTDNIIVPFKNMMNDAYCADISIKVRSQLELKRKMGDFVGAFAVYGYTKDKDNHNKLTIDEFAADVVRDIYRWKLEGMSALGISERLNQIGILSPMEYKRYNGLRYSTSFKVNTTAKWSAVAVSRILKNAVYTGVLEQGKRVTPNFKVSRRVELPKEKWIRTEGAHEPIVERNTFDTVQKLLKQDTRAGVRNGTVYPLSGIIVCGDCGSAMVHKTNTKNGKRYSYYVCSRHRADKTICSTHILSVAACENAVLSALKVHTAAILNIEKMMECAEKQKYRSDSIRKLTARLDAKRDEIRRYCDYRLSLHESFADGIISQEDFISFKKGYDEKIKDAETAISILTEDIETAASDSANGNDWMGMFKSYMDASALERRMVAELIDRVTVFEKSRIEVEFAYQNEFERLSEFLDVEVA